MLLERLSQFVEQPRVLDGDDGLGGVARHQFDLFVGKRRHFLTVDGEGTDQVVVPEYWNSEDRPEAAKIDRSHEYGFTVDVSWFGRDVGNMNRLPGFSDAA